MNIEKVKLTSDSVIESLLKMGYSERRVGEQRRCYKLIVKYGDRDDICTYEDFYNKIVVPRYAAATVGDIKACLGDLWYYDTYGKIPNPYTQNGFMSMPVKRYESLSDEFKLIVELYCSTKLKNGNEKRAIDDRRYSIVKFLGHCMKNGLVRVSDITEDVICAYYKAEQIQTSELTRTLRDAFSYASDRLPECASLVPLFPAIKPTLKPFEALDSEEACKLKNTIINMDDSWLLRDKAIATIVYYLSEFCIFCNEN